MKLRLMLLCLIVIAVVGSFHIASADSVFTLIEERDWDGLVAAVESGADVQQVQDDGYSVLMASLWEFAPPEVVEVLLDAGADVNHTALNGDNALFVAIGSITDEALQNERLSVERSVEVLQLLVDRGAVVDYQSADGRTPLLWLLEMMYAVDGLLGPLDVEVQFLEVVQLLVEAGADVNLANNEGTTPVMSAAQQGKTEIVRCLVDEGALIDTQDGSGYSALMLAATSNQVEVVELLVELGADLDLQTKFGDTALTLVSDPHYFEWFEEVALVLVGAGARVDVESSYGETTIDHALMLFDHHPELLLAIIDAGYELEPQPGLPVLAVAIDHPDKASSLARLVDDDGKRLQAIAFTNEVMTLFQEGSFAELEGLYHPVVVENLQTRRGWQDVDLALQTELEFERMHSTFNKDSYWMIESVILNRDETEATIIVRYSRDPEQLQRISGGIELRLWDYNGEWRLEGVR